MVHQDRYLEIVHAVVAHAASPHQAQHRALDVTHWAGTNHRHVHERSFNVVLQGTSNRAGASLRGQGSNANARLRELLELHNLLGFLGHFVGLLLSLIHCCAHLPPGAG